MLLSKMVEIELNSSNISRYEKLGYKIPRIKDVQYRWVVPKDTKILVKVEDLPKGSYTKIKVKCDYCRKEFEKGYNKFIKQRNSIVKKDACTDCRHLKSKDVFLQKYGVTQNTQIPEVKENLSKSLREDENKVRADFKKLGYDVVEEEFNYINDCENIKFICSKHPEEGIQETNYRVVKHHSGGCKKCRYKKISGENCHLWKGGSTPIEVYLRDRIIFWKKETMEYCNYICRLSGLKFDIVHHIYPFTYICNEALENLKIQNKNNISEYSEIELTNLTKKCLELHKKYGMGVCLNFKLHLLYHAKYHKNEEINLKTFLEFAQRYYNGEFDNDLDEEIKSYNSIKRLKENGTEINLKEAI